MHILGLGLDYDTGQPLFDEIDEAEFAGHVLTGVGLGAGAKGVLPTTEEVFRSEIERERTVDLGDPRAAGWTILVNAADPRKEAYLQALAPLAARREMKGDPLLYHGEPQEDWFSWLLDNYTPTDGSRPPFYVLIAGDPQQVPFGLQALLSTSAAVGRLDFNAIEQLQAYVEKILALESAASPVAGREVLFFAPDGGRWDPTYFSRRYMVEPLERYTRTALGFATQALLAAEATKPRLADCLRGSRPALVYTASHGLGALRKPLEVQKQINGALCCQPVYDGELAASRAFSAADIPLDEPFLPGSVFFQFACYGYGTPAESDFAHWSLFPARSQNAPADFVAAIPQRLLAHPEGPIAYIGHVDTAWLHGFDDPDDPELRERWNPRLAPFQSALKSMLSVQPVGLALSEINKRYNQTNAHLTNIYDRLKRGRIQETEEFRAMVASTFITRSDAQNYMLFADPAARLRI